jgi:hypothetical protein
VILEHEVVGYRGWNHDQVGLARLQCGVDEPRLGTLDVAAVTATALRIEEQIVLPEQFRHVRLERDQVRGVLRVAPNRNGAGDVFVEQPEWAAKQVDPGSDDRRPHVVVVQHEQFDQVVGVALVVRGVHDATGARGALDDIEMLGDAFDLPQDRVERVFERPVHRRALRRTKFLQIPFDPRERLRASHPVAALEVPRDLLA